MPAVVPGVAAFANPAGEAAGLRAGARFTTPEYVVLTLLKF
eukprot:gene44999-58866_t